MMRDAKASHAYWNEWVDFSKDRIEKVIELRQHNAPVNDVYEPQYVLDLAWRYVRLIIQSYSRGDSVAELTDNFAGFLDAWEEAEKLGKEVWNDAEQSLRHSWALNLHFYMDCFWLTGLALALEIPDEQWERLLALMGNEGEDVLLDKVIASRQPGRRIDNKLRFPKAYKKLLQVVEAPPDAQPDLLRAYLDGWYPGLKNAGSPEVERYLRTPYWYTYGDQNFEGGAYFGRWCIEAVAAAKAFGIDDSKCLDHPNYPGDLISDGRSPRYSDTVPSALATLTMDATRKDEICLPARRDRSWLSRLLVGPGK